MISGIDKYFKPIQTRRATLTTDEWGNPISQYSDHIVINGMIRELSGSEIQNARKDTHTSTHRMYCRIADVKNDDQIFYKGEIYRVVNINNVNNFDELLQIDCEMVK